MSFSASIARNGSYAAIGTGLYSLCQFAILVLFARYEQVVMLGQYALALAISAPIFMLSNMRMRFIAATDTECERSFALYNSTRALLSAIAVVVSLGVTYAMTRDTEMVALVGALALVRSVESFSDLIYGVYQKTMRLELMAVSMALAGLGLVAAVAVALEFGLALINAIWIMLAVRISLYLAFDLPRRTALVQSNDDTASFEMSSWPAVVSLVKICWPLGVVALLVSLNTNVPRYFIESVLGAEMLGIFAALAYIPIAGYLIVGNIGQIWMPEISRQTRAKKLNSVKRLIVQLAGFGLVAGLLATAFGWFFGEQFLSFVYGPAFAHHSQLFLLLMCAGAVSYVTVGGIYALTAIGSYMSQLYVYIADLILIFALCAVFIPLLGLTGGAIAMIVTQLIQVVVVYLLIVFMLRAARA